MRVIWTDPALERVEETALFIAQDSPAAARRWVMGLFAAVEGLRDFPESGRAVPEAGARSARELIVGAYRVVYRVGAAVEVLTVRHVRQLPGADGVGVSPIR